MELTQSQSKALVNLNNWYNGSSYTPAILQGAAGFGKTYLITSFLQNLGNRVKPLLLAETNEAVNVLCNITGNLYPTSTICKALGLQLGFQQHKQLLIKRSDPDLSEYNLLIVDEASQVDVERLSYLQDTGKMILYIGHKSQLPPVNTELKSHDDCISPVFTRNYPTFSLTDPVRNTGSIFKFCQEAERLIYERGLLNSSFKVQNNFVDAYLNVNKEAIFTSSTIFLAYTNNRVGELNKLARYSVYGEEAKTYDYLIGDKLILRSPTYCFAHKLTNGTTIDHCLRKKNIQLDTNTRAEVIGITYNTVLGLSCYELFIKTKLGDKGFIYVALNSDEQDALKKKMYTSALYDSNTQSSNKKWANYHNLTLVLSNAKHSYAMTVHCAQGSTIENVFVDDKDIDKVNNPILKKKLRYVAYSRAKDNLYRMN